MTAIEWTDETLNPIRARNKATGQVGWWCAHASPGCINCYAEAMNLWRGNGVPFKAQYRDEVELFLDEKTLARPLSWSKPKRIFVCDMTDLFGDWVPFEWIDRILGIANRCPHHTLQILTKRAERMSVYVQDRYKLGMDPHQNVWLGISVEDQARASERLEHLKVCHALGARTFVSYEPALEAVDWVGYEFIDWLIIGGESGRKARPFSDRWAYDAIVWAKENHVSVFMKQRGSQPTNGPRVKEKRGDMDEWPANLRIREFPA